MVVISSLLAPRFRLCWRPHKMDRSARGGAHPPTIDPPDHQPLPILQPGSAMATAVEHLGHELAGVRTGRANPGLLENIPVDAHGERVPLKACGAVTVRGAQQLVVTVYDATVSALVLSYWCWWWRWWWWVLQRLFWLRWMMAPLLRMITSTHTRIQPKHTTKTTTLTPPARRRRRQGDPRVAAEPRAVARGRRRGARAAAAHDAGHDREDGQARPHGGRWRPPVHPARAPEGHGRDKARRQGAGRAQARGARGAARVCKYLRARVCVCVCFARVLFRCCSCVRPNCAAVCVRRTDGVVANKQNAMNASPPPPSPFTPAAPAPARPLHRRGGPPAQAQGRGAARAPRLMAD